MANAMSWLMPRLRGEDDQIRERIASLHFSLALWTYAGGAEQYEIELMSTDGSREIQTLTPQSKGRESEAEVSPFRLAFEADAAILHLETFNRGKEEEFAGFLPRAFAEIANNQAEILIIDLRKNGGGARDLSDRLMAYITDSPYSPISAVTARIVPENQRLIPTASLGDVVSVPFVQRVDPPHELKHRFEGKVWLLIGPNTYSQAIVFATTAKDHEFAQLAGLPTSGRANQTGQVKRTKLPGSGFEVQSPIYVFVRSSGDRSSDPLRPDVEIEELAPADYPTFIERLKRNVSSSPSRNR